MAARAAGWDEADINRFATQDMLQRQMSTAAVGNTAAQPAQQKKKSFLVDNISTLGGILGAIGGSFVAPVAGTAAGGAAGAGLGEAIENKISGEDVTKNVGKEALLGGLFSAGPIRLAKYAKGGTAALRGGASAGEAMQSGEQAVAEPFRYLFQHGAPQSAETGTARATAAPRITKVNQTAAGRQYAKAFGDIPAKISQNLKLPQTAQELHDYGVRGSLDDIQGTSKRIMDLIGGTVSRGASDINGYIKTGEIESVLNNALKGVNVTPQDKRALMEIVTDASSKGPLPGYIHPQDALDLARKLERRGFQRINSGKNIFNPNDNAVDFGSAHVQAANEVEDNLYKAIQGKATLSKYATPETINELNGLAKGLGDRFKQVAETNDAQGMRSLMAPFVRANQLANFASNSDNTAFKNLTRGFVGRRGGIVGTAVDVGEKLAAPILQRNSSRIATNSAGAVDNLSRFNPFRAPGSAGGGKRVVSSPAGLSVRNYAANEAGQTQPPSITGTANAQQPQQPDQFDPFAQMSGGGGAGGTDPSSMFAGGSGTPGGDMNIDVGGQQYPLSSFTPDVINQMLQDDIAKTGGKNIDEISKIVSIQKALTSDTSGSGVSASQQKALIGTQTASGLVDNIEQTMSQITGGRVGGLLSRAKGAVGLDPRVKAYEDQKGIISFNIAKALQGTGSQLSDRDVKVINSSIPQVTDTPQEVQLKLQRLRDIIEQNKRAIMSVPSTGSSFEPGSMFDGGGQSDQGQQGFDPFQQFNYGY